jgi:hypothetical protein
MVAVDGIDPVSKVDMTVGVDGAIEFTGTGVCPLNDKHAVSINRSSPRLKFFTTILFSNKVASPLAKRIFAEIR